MNREMYKKARSSKLTFENEKENTSGSDLESLLVSSVRCDTQLLMPNGESQGPEGKSKPSQSLIKKQYVSNVYIDESNENKCQTCVKKLEAINENLTLVNLKMQQLQSKLNLCFGKYGKTQTRMGEIELLMEQFRHLEVENCEKVKEIISNTAKHEQEVSFKLRDYTEELARVKKIAVRLEERDSGDRAILETKRIDHKLERWKDEQEFKLKEIVDVVQRVGSLQRKLIEQGERSDDSTMQLQEPRRRYLRSYSICEKAKTNESTNISYSRNYDFPK